MPNVEQGGTEILLDFLSVNVGILYQTTPLSRKMVVGLVGNVTISAIIGAGGW